VSEDAAVKRMGQTRRRAAMADKSETFFGVYRATVSDTADPQGQRRVKVAVPTALGRKQIWARVTAPPGRKHRVPTPDDEVLVAFEAGDSRQPYVIGWLWRSDDRPPESRGTDRGGARLARRGKGIRVTTLIA
jgi:uncharacterized protein involved in type VI secretion and phage assembly